MQYTEEEFTKLIEAVEKEFISDLAKAEQAFRLSKSEESAAPSVDGTEPLAKAEDEKPGEAKEKKEDKEKEPKSEEKPAAEGKDAKAPPKAEAEEQAEGEAEQADPAAEATAPGAEGAHGYDAEDLAHLEEMYGSMSRAELMAHHDAVKHCLDAMGMEDAAAPADAPLAPEAAPAADAPPAEAPPMVKTEAADDSLLKSELNAEKAKSEELKKSLDAVSEFLTKLVSKKVAPAGKAITNVETIAKSEATAEEKVFTKSEINSILTKKTADPSLKKSDRDLINAFYLVDGTSINSISHLLK